MSKYIVIVLILCFLSSCIVSVKNKEKHILIESYVKKLNGKEQIKLFPLWPQCEFKEDSIALSFFSYHKVQFKEAKWIVYECLKELLAYVNKQELGCFSQQLDIKKISFSIMFIKENGCFVEDNCISMIYFYDGALTYAVFDSQMQRLERICREPLDLSFE